MAKVSTRFESETVFVKLYRIADRLISIEGTDEWAADVAESFINCFYLVASNWHGNETLVDCRIKVSVETPPSVPPHLTSFEVPHGVCYTDRQHYFFDVEDSLIHIPPTGERTVSVWFGNTPRAKHPVRLANVMAYVLSATLRRAALYDLHAAGLVEPSSGVGVLLVGASNAGKSSLSVRLAKSGWRYLSDDMVVLSRHEEGVEARGLRRLFAVSATSLAGCDLPRLEDALGGSVASDPSKRRLEPAMVFPDGLAEKCLPGVLCFPTITGEPESRLRAIGQAEAMTLLIKHCPWSSYDVPTATEHLDVLGRLAKQTRAFKLSAGRDVLADPALPGKLLAQTLVP